MVAKRKVEVCVSNLELGSDEVCQRVTETLSADVRVKRWGCLGYCHRCIHNPYVLIDDDLYLEAESPEALWDLVCAELTARKAQ